jgi:hypothetical protein
MNRLQELAGIANTSHPIVEGLGKLKPEDIKIGSDYLFTLPGVKYEKTVYSAPIKVKVLGALNDQWFSITPLEDKEGLKRNEKYKAEYTNLHSLDTKFDGFNNPLQEVAPVSPTAAPKQTADVASLTKLIQSNTPLMNKLKTVNSGQEVTETIAFILNNINPKVTGVQKQKLKDLIDQRFK